MSGGGYVYCPNCGAEYRQGFDICSDCNVALQPEPLEGAGHEGVIVQRTLNSKDFGSVEPVCVHVATALIDAEIVLSALRSNGVRAFSEGSGMELWTEAGAIGQMTRAPGPLNSTRIMVHPDDEEDARAILRDFPEDEAEVEPSESASQAPVPVEPDRGKRVRRVVAAVLISVVLSGVVFQAVELISRLVDES